jgi:hypothetical protein
VASPVELSDISGSHNKIFTSVDLGISVWLRAHVGVSWSKNRLLLPFEQKVGHGRHLHLYPDSWLKEKSKILYYIYVKPCSHNKVHDATHVVIVS